MHKQNIINNKYIVFIKKSLNKIIKYIEHKK